MIRLILIILLLAVIYLGYRYFLSQAISDSVREDSHKLRKNKLKAALKKRGLSVAEEDLELFIGRQISEEEFKRRAEAYSKNLKR